MAAVGQRVRVLGAYRQLLQSIRLVFGGDQAALTKTRGQARKAFLQNSSERDAARIDKLVADAGDASDFLRNHIVQAALNDAGRYEMKLQPTHGDGGGAAAGKIQVQPATVAAEAGKDDAGDSGSCCGGGCR